MNRRIVAACELLGEKCRELAAIIDELRDGLLDAWPHETVVK